MRHVKLLTHPTTVNKQYILLSSQTWVMWFGIYCKLILQALHPDEDDSAEDDEVADEDEEEPGMFDDAEEETNGAGEAGDGPEQMDAD